MTLPTRKDERWKYTDVAVIANVATPGVRQHYQVVAPAGVIICDLQTALIKYPTLIQKLNLNINTALHPLAKTAEQGFFIYVPDNYNISEVASLLITNPALNNTSQNIIIVGKNSAITLLLEYRYEQVCYVNQTTHIYLDEGANLQAYQIQNNATEATRIAHTFVQQQKESMSQFGFFDLDHKFNREELVINLEGAGASANTCGFYHLRKDEQYVDHHVDILHNAAHTQSEMLYKGILDKKSRAVFNGRLYVKEKAQKISAYQANHNVLLSNQAEVYSKPELEIYADDVKCKHGASTGQLDEEALFYLRSRGIEITEAKRLLLAGFADEVLQRVKTPAIRPLIEEFLSC